MRASPMLSLCLLLAACGGTTRAPRERPPRGEDASDERGDGAERESVKPVEVNTKETPVMRCGAPDSYAYVAREFKCPDGSNPLGGNPRAGAAARVGNVGANSNGHIIDLYEIPCAQGPQRVYVDMYGCKDEPRGGGTGI